MISERNDNELSKQNDAKCIKANEVTFIDGSKDIVTGVIRLFNTNEREVLLNQSSSYFNINNVLSVKPIDVEVCPNCDELIEATDLYADGGAVANVKHCVECNWSDGGKVTNE
ncbi:hypothetical protein CN646_07525 [Bacillus wiedmannii]|uniref:hypothetical protein n=1 Tax=Bacillus wiedmannii TaxID=1890302 RepID=UPI000BF19BC9|nr:hypothetical protein [Bacillus wiedmannii]PEI73439.1 hypothetical protein CN646_07525 [Bacillus wiedmannii]PFZ67725.1 hypothetical protein COL76_01190 [Bacillus wiedmannii]